MKTAPIYQADTFLTSPDALALYRSGGNFQAGLPVDLLPSRRRHGPREKLRLTCQSWAGARLLAARSGASHSRGRREGPVTAQRSYTAKPCPRVAPPIPQGWQAGRAEGGYCLATEGSRELNRPDQIPSHARLCYVDNNVAWFTEAPLTGDGRCWGDDWNDAPYEHNAGTPYDAPWRLAYAAPALETPGERASGNSRHSVEQINAGAEPWLRTHAWSKAAVEIKAGVGPMEFVAAVERSGGEVLVPWSEVRVAVLEAQK